MCIPCICWSCCVPFLNLNIFDSNPDTNIQNNSINIRMPWISIKPDGIEMPGISIKNN